MRACPISFLHYLQSRNTLLSAPPSRKVGIVPRLSLSGPLLPPGRPVLVTGTVKGAVVIGGTEEPLHLILIQIRLAVIGIRFRIVLVINAVLTIRHSVLLTL